MPTAAVNNLLVVETRLWALAEAWPGLVTVIPPATRPLMMPKNKIKYDDPKITWPDRAKSRQNVADSIEFELDVPFSGTPDSRQARTFCLQPDVSTFDFVWKLTSETKQLNYILQAHAELKACMVAAGTQLGIPAIVARWEQQFRPGRAKEDTQRQILWTMKITVKG